MQLAYDPQTNTIFDAATGAAVAVLYDDLPSEQRHALGRLMAAAEGMQEALRTIANQHSIEEMSEKEAENGDLIGAYAAIVALARAAEPPR